MVSDFDLLEAWSEGDQSAGEELLGRHFSSLYYFFANKVDAGVDDLVQQTLLGCVESRHRFRGDASFRTYLFSIARYQLYDVFRRRARAPITFDPHTQSTQQLAASPSSVMNEQQQHFVLLRALRQLPLELQTALELHYWEELRTEELAHILEIPVGTVKSRLQRARKMLRGAIQQFSSDRSEGEPTLGDLDAWARSVRTQVENETR